MYIHESLADYIAYGITLFTLSNIASIKAELLNDNTIERQFEVSVNVNLVCRWYLSS